PTRTHHCCVELVTVQYQQPLTTRGAVHPFTMDLELPAQHLREHAEALVMIAGDVHQTRSRTLTREQRAHDLSVRAGPEGAPREAERIADVADQHDAFGVDTVQELIELPDPRVPEAEMDV